MDTKTEGDDLQAAALDGARGEFWIDGGPHRAGTVHYRDGELRVVTEGIARPPRYYRFGDGWMDITGDPPDAVADFAPVPLLGTLADGRQVTVVDGRLTPELPSESQAFSGKRVLLGVHAPTVATTFTAARIALPQPGLWRGVLSGAGAREVRLGERVGSLRAVVDGQVGWLELSFDDGLVEREWERRFWGRVVTLLRLWTHAALREERVQLSPGADGGWVDLLYAGVKRSETTHAWGSLLPPAALSLDAVADALTVFDELAPVPDVAVKQMSHEVTLELAVLANAAALEGLHRGTPGGRLPFPGLKSARPIAQAAAEAAAASLAEQGVVPPEDVPAAVVQLTGAFSYFNQPSFRERLEELLPPVERVAPGLIGSDRDGWIGAVVRARNMEAHRFPQKPPERARYRQRVDGYYVLATSTEWVLRIALLLRLGVAPELLHARLLEHNQFEFALANMDHAEDPPGSRLDEFRASRAGGRTSSP